MTKLKRGTLVSDLMLLRGVSQPVTQFEDIKVIAYLTIYDTSNGHMCFFQTFPTRNGRSVFLMVFQHAFVPESFWSDGVWPRNTAKQRHIYLCVSLAGQNVAG